MGNAPRPQGIETPRPHLPSGSQPTRTPGTLGCPYSTSHCSRRVSHCVAGEPGALPGGGSRLRPFPPSVSPPSHPKSSSLCLQTTGALVTGEEPQASGLRLLVTASRKPPLPRPVRVSHGRAGGCDRARAACGRPAHGTAGKAPRPGPRKRRTRDSPLLCQRAARQVCVPGRISPAQCKPTATARVNFPLYSCTLLWS